MIRPLLVVALAVSVCPVGVNAADGLIIRLNDGRVEVAPYQLPRSGRDNQIGIAVWSQGGAEQWAVLPGELRSGKAATPAALALRSATRGGAGSGSAAGPETMTFQPEQLLGQVVTRAAGLTFITPPDQSVYLAGTLTIRRTPDDGAEKYPAANAVLRRGSKDLFTIALPAKKAELRWDEIVPAEWQGGLTPGAYSLRVEKGPVTSFQVVDGAVRDELLQPLAELAEVAGATSPVYFLALVQRLSCWKDEEGEFKSFAADALDRLDAVAKKQPELAKAAWLNKLRERILTKLTTNDAKKSADVAATGVEIIDQARAAIQEGAWEAALQTLAEPAAEETPRAQALAILYRGVIAAESGAAAGETPDRLFQEALAKLQDGEPADKFRAHNNYGGLLFARARDQVHNHSFQTAGGVSTPILRALDDWRGAQFHYEQALASAEKLDPSLAAATQVNLARLNSLLADLIRVLDFAADGSRRFSEGETTAAIAATEMAQHAIEKPDAIDAVTRAAAFDVLAQLAFRAEKWEVAKRRAEQSLAAYVEAESLPGAEGVERLLGLIALHDKPDAALKHLQTSHLLTEMLRERLPADRAGRSRAGFFARRAYVSERMVELLIAQGKDEEALLTAEGAKARSLQDVLAQRGVTTASSGEHRGVKELLADWPAETAAVEYFLGAEHAWGFVINPAGKVKAWPLADAAGKPLASRDLVRRVRTLLADFEGQANKMFRRASAGQGFDHAWQDELHQFAEELLPKSVRDELQTAKHVVFVPHHVLNYFPFAALVTELDPTPRGKLELPQPKFLIDEAYSLSRAPSLAAWDLLRRKDSTFAQVQAVGIVEFEQAEPLPGVEKDLANLKAAFGERLKKTVVADAADEAGVRELLREPGMLFVGTHGQNVAEEPLTSYLLCHARGDHDGRLTAGELFGEEVAASLIVMSACYSGLADQSPLPGDDLFGLERAFLNAGASTIVSGLWDVYDETGPTLMQSFFQNMVAGKPAAEALAGAQRDFVVARRKEGAGDPWMHPYFWAVYTLSGSELTALERSAR